MNEKEKVEGEVEKEGKSLEELKHQNNKCQNGKITCMRKLGKFDC